ncbi:MAG: hypothetical protein V9G23_02910 [Giesbergeria sp.]
MSNLPTAHAPTVTTPTVATPTADRPATGYELVVGMEVHAQVQTHSKMFCTCATDYAGAPPNTRDLPSVPGAAGQPACGQPRRHRGHHQDGDRAQLPH